MTSVVEINRKDYRLLGFGFMYVKGITDENEIIKGCILFAFNKQILTLAIADTEWVDEHGKPYRFHLDGTVLFMKRIALGVGKRDI